MIGSSSKLISNMVREIVIATTIRNLQESFALKKYNVIVTNPNSTAVVF